METEDPITKNPSAGATSETSDDEDLDFSTPITGRVVRLQFQCHAELPIGSYLRVTGSSLWAPGNTPSDPMNAHHIAQERQSDAFPTPEGDGTIEGGDNVAYWYNHPTNLYASSVEMVTSPETYPIWTTKQPVIVVLNPTSSAIQHHYYRYLVVTPGAGNEDSAVTGDDLEGATSTSPPDASSATSSPVMMWEHPFAAAENNNNEQQQQQQQGNSMPHQPSTQSFASQSTMAAGGGAAKDQFTSTLAQLAQLPYRTLDINVETALVASPLPEDRLDTWNNPEDPTLQAYQIRESMSRTAGGGGGDGSDPNNNKQHHQRSNSAQSSLSGFGDDYTMEDAVMANSSAGTTSKASMTTDSNKMEEDDQPTTTSTTSSVPLPPPAPIKKSLTKILFVCFHLPVVVCKVNGEWQATWSESLLAQKEGSRIVSTYRAHWIGTVTPHPPIINESDRVAVRKILADMDCTPIFINPSTRQAHYYGFCKQVLWPAFHNIDLLDLSTSGVVGGGGKSGNELLEGVSDWDQSRLDHWWDAYRQVNQEFATVVNSLVDRDSSTYLWIHDYHLSLLPQYLNEEPAKSCRKVFFLHIPFPTSQIFRELECGEAILRGMLHADVVGFHAFDHARHFLNAGKRILGLNYESLVGGLIGVQFMGRTVLVSMSNVSIEPKMADAGMTLPSVQQGCQELRSKHGDRKIICGADVGQRLSGISLKLLAYERLLQDYPSWHSKVVMVQRVLVPGSRKIDEQVTLRELRYLVQRIQERFGAAVIDYQEINGSSLPMDQRLALWKASDVLMLTPIREGLNYWPMEYIYAKDADSPGVVIASEFSAVCSILNGALRVNPFDIQLAVTVVDKALSMEFTEREGRRYRDLDFVKNCPSDKWVRNVLRDLNDATASSSRKSGNNSSTDTPTASLTPQTSASMTPRRTKREQLHGTAAFLLKESHAAFTHLNPRTVKHAYDRSKNRVIILDFNGTIVMKEPPGKYLKREILGSSGNKPPPEVLEALALLCEDRKNTVYVVSGDSSENVVNALGHLPNLGLAVSNGARFSPPLGDNDSERRWQTFDLGVDWDAVKRVALPVLSKYTARSNGSFVKLTTFSIGWSYYSCDPEWGSLQAAHLVLELESELKAFDVRFVTLKGVVEVVPRKLNKGLIVRKVLRDTTRKISASGGIDFCLCFGDDISDEKMFSSVFAFTAEMGREAYAQPDPPVQNEDGSMEPATDWSQYNTQVPDPMYCYTCAVGKKPSHASTYVTDAAEVARALVLLAKGEEGSRAVGTAARNMFD